MRDPLAALLARPDIVRRPPADPHDLADAEFRMGFACPLTLSRLWRSSAGIDFPTFGSRILSPAEVHEFSPPTSWDERIQDGWFPIMSRPGYRMFRLATRGPLVGRIACFFSDRLPRLIYRSFDRLAEVLANPRTSIDGTAGLLPMYEIDYLPIDVDYLPNLRRTPDERAIGRQLLNDEFHPARRVFAVDLLDDTDSDSWRQLFSTEADYRIRQAALSRAIVSVDPSFREILDLHLREFEAFAESVYTAVGKSGLRVGERFDAILEFHHNRFIELSEFFARRTIPDAVPRLVDWLRDLAEERDPLDRPGHFFADRTNHESPTQASR